MQNGRNFGGIFAFIATVAIAFSQASDAEELAVLKPNSSDESIWQARYSADGRHIVAKTLSKVIAFDAKSFKQTQSFPCELPRDLTSIAQDGRFAVKDGGSILIYKLGEATRVGKIDDGYHTNHLAISPSGNFVATFDQSRTNSKGLIAAIFDTTNGQRKFSLEVGLSQGDSLAFVDDTYLAMCGRDLNMKPKFAIWEMRSGKHIHDFPVDGEAGAFCVSGNGKKMAVARDYEGHVDIYFLDHGKLIKESTIRLDDSVGHNLTMSADGDRIAAWTRYRLAIHDVVAKRRAEVEIKKTATAEGEIDVDPQAGQGFVHLAPNGSRVLLGDHRTVTRVWNLAADVEFAKPLRPLAPERHLVQPALEIKEIFGKAHPYTWLMELTREMDRSSRWESILTLEKGFPKEMREYCAQELIRSYRGVGNEAAADALSEEYNDKNRGYVEEMRKEQFNKGSSLHVMRMQTNLGEILNAWPSLAEEGGEAFAKRTARVRKEYEFAVDNDPSGACRFGLAVLRACQGENSSAIRTMAREGGAARRLTQQKDQSFNSLPEWKRWNEFKVNLDTNWLVNILDDDFSEADQRVKEIARMMQVVRGFSNPAYSRFSLASFPQYSAVAFLPEKDTQLASPAYEFVMNSRRSTSQIQNRSQAIGMSGASQDEIFEYSGGTSHASSVELQALASAMSLILPPQEKTYAAAIQRDYLSSAARLLHFRRNIENENLARVIAQPIGEGWIGVADVQKALKDRQAVIEIVRGQSFDFSYLKSGIRFMPAQYSAWLVIRNRTPIYINLGPAEKIDALIAEIRSDIEQSTARTARLGRAQTEKETSQKLQKLADVLLKPIRSQLADIDDLMICPDGDLWLLPWGALPLQGEKSLLEHCDISLHFSSSGFVLAARREGDRLSRTFSGKPVIMANPDFDASVSEVQQMETKLLDKSIDDKIKIPLYGGQRLLGQFQPLPGASREATRIAPILKRLTGKEPLIYSEGTAIEAVAKSLHSPEYLVFATHGYFLPQIRTREIRPNTGLTQTEHVHTVAFTRTNVDFFKHIPATKAPMDLLAPQLRGGLALAGANNCDKWGTVRACDGLLTASEVESIDLRGTKLVVLSACETGLGEVQVGEGVRGLREAFFVAGAQSVVASLWQVSDDETAKLMELFFDHLSRGSSPRTAMRAASLERLRERRKTDTAHPYYWAAFSVTERGY